MHGQVAFARAAQEAGADWVILQPPPVAGLAEAEYLRFFGAVADAAPLPVAIQNAAQFLGIGLSNAALATLHRNHPNVSLLKGEAPAHVIARLIDDTGGAFRVFNGRGGLELPDCLRAGCVGMIPAPECFDLQVAIYDAMQRGDARTRRERALPRDAAAGHVHDELDRHVRLLRQAHRGAAPGLGRRARSRAGAAADAVRARGDRALRCGAAPAVRLRTRLQPGDSRNIPA